jgi:hypothetical protein
MSRAEADALAEASLTASATPDDDIGEVAVADRIPNGHVRFRQRVAGTLVTTAMPGYTACRVHHAAHVAHWRAKLGGDTSEY